VKIHPEVPESSVFIGRKKQWHRDVGDVECGLYTIVCVGETSDIVGVTSVGETSAPHRLVSYIACQSRSWITRRVRLISDVQETRTTVGDDGSRPNTQLMQRLANLVDELLTESSSSASPTSP